MTITADIKSGLAFHCHHDILYEHVYDYDERVKYILGNKPIDEQALRLKLFQLIPTALIPGLNSPEWTAYHKAEEAHDEAREAYDKAREAYDEAREAHDEAREAYDKAREAYDEAWEAYHKAWEALDEAKEALDEVWKAYDKAWKAYRKVFGKEIDALHKELCPNCPWNGETIFS